MISRAVSSSPTTSLIASSLSSPRVDLSLISSDSCTAEGVEQTVYEQVSGAQGWCSLDQQRQLPQLIDQQRQLPQLKQAVGRASKWLCQGERQRCCNVAGRHQPPAQAHSAVAEGVRTWAYW